MADTKSTRSEAEVAAVGYIRRSTNKQEKSLSEQRNSIERYAQKNGYKILRWYQDDGISGDATERRTGFQQLHQDACNGSDFQAIICWDFSRFGRFDSIEAGRWIDPLRKAGVQLVTTDRGLIDWNDFGGRLINAIEAEGKHAYLRDLSRTISRSQIATASEGKSCGQRPPYGYDRSLLDENGVERLRVKRGEQYAKPRNWRVVWTPADDPQEVATVRWLFETYATKDIGYRALADQLNQKGVASPNGGKWFDSTVRALLANRAYVGAFVWNKRRHGKYHRIVNGDIVARDRREIHLMPCGKPNARNNPPELWTVVENAHPAIVAQDTFDAVQKKIERRKRANGTGYQTHTSRRDREPYLLTGLLYCEKCGCRMHGATSKRRKNGREYSYQKYICSSNTRGDRSCGHFAVRQEHIFPAVIDKIREDLFQGGREQLRSSFRRKLTQRQGPDLEQLRKLRKRIHELDGQMEIGAERVLTSPPDLVDVLSAKLQKMKQEREELRRELVRLESAEKPIDIDKNVRHLVDRAWTLLEELKESDPAGMREFLLTAIERIDLSFTTRQEGKRKRHLATGGTIKFRELSGFVSREFRGPVELFLASVAEWDAYISHLVLAA